MNYFFSVKGYSKGYGFQFFEMKIQVSSWILKVNGLFTIPVLDLALYFSTQHRNSIFVQCTKMMHLNHMSPDIYHGNFRIHRPIATNQFSNTDNYTSPEFYIECDPTLNSCLSRSDSRQWSVTLWLIILHPYYADLVFHRSIPSWFLSSLVVQYLSIFPQLFLFKIELNLGFVS